MLGCGCVAKTCKGFFPTRSCLTKIGNDISFSRSANFSAEQGVVCSLITHCGVVVGPASATGVHRIHAKWLQESKSEACMSWSQASSLQVVWPSLVESRANWSIGSFQVPHNSQRSQPYLSSAGHLIEVTILPPEDAGSSVGLFGVRPSCAKALRLAPSLVGLTRLITWSPAEVE